MKLHNFGQSISSAALAMLLVATLSIPACAQTSGLSPTTAPSATSSPTTGQASPSASEPAEEAAIKCDSKTKAILDRLEKAGEKYRTLQADLELVVDMPQLGDREERTGWVAYQRESDKAPEKIRVHFDTLRQGEGPKIKEKLDYAFDGAWASEAKYSVKQLTRWQVAAEGERVEAMRIGKGAFPPLPFGQKTAEVLEYYQAAFQPPAAGDPNNCDAVKLIAYRHRRKDLDFLELTIFVDRATSLPVKVVGADKDKNVKTVLLKNTQPGKPLAADMFELKPGLGWSESTKRLEKTRGED